MLCPSQSTVYNPPVTGRVGDKVTHCVTHTHRAGIESVFNLQQPGEHKNCGPGLEESSGFTYQPEHLMSQGGVCVRVCVCL